MIKLNNLLTVEHDLSKFLFKDPVASALLWYFLLDHPGEEENGSSVSIKELSDKLSFTPRVIQRRMDLLEGEGFIKSFTPELYGGSRLPSIYQINFESEFYIRPAKKRVVIKPEESPDVGVLIQRFTDINLATHGQEYKPNNPSQRSKWVKGAEKILTLKTDGAEFSMETYEKVVSFLANQMKESLKPEPEPYMMQCRDLGNLVYTHPNQSDCKYINAYRKMSTGSTIQYESSVVINNILKGNDEHTNGYGHSENGSPAYDSLWEEVQ